MDIIKLGFETLKSTISSIGHWLRENLTWVVLIFVSFALPVASMDRGLEDYLSLALTTLGILSLSYGLYFTINRLDLMRDSNFTQTLSVVRRALADSNVDIRISGLTDLKDLLAAKGQPKKNYAHVRQILQNYITERARVNPQEYGIQEVPSEMQPYTQTNDIAVAIQTLMNSLDPNDTKRRGQINLTGLNLQGLKFEECDFSHIVFGSVDAVPSSLARVKFVTCRAKQARFSYTRLSNANFGSSNFPCSRFNYADLSNAIVDSACFTGAFFVGANLIGTLAYKGDTNWPGNFTDHQIGQMASQPEFQDVE